MYKLEGNFDSLFRKNVPDKELKNPPEQEEKKVSEAHDCSQPQEDYLEEPLLPENIASRPLDDFRDHPKKLEEFTRITQADSPSGDSQNTEDDNQNSNSDLDLQIETNEDTDSNSSSEKEEIDLEIDEISEVDEAILDEEISEPSEFELDWDSNSDAGLSSIITISDEDLNETDQESAFYEEEMLIPETTLEVDAEEDPFAGKDRISARLMKILASVGEEEVPDQTLERQKFRDSHVDSDYFRKYLRKAGKTDNISTRLMKILGEAALVHPQSDEEETDQFDNEINNLDSIICQKEGEGPLVYHCKLCKVDLHGRKQYNMHKGRHLKKTCPECGLTIRKDYFKKHKLQHVLGKQVCDICGSEHKSFNGLRMHMFNVHNDNKKIYKCEECNLTFRYKHRFNHHNRHVHIGLRPYQCDHCGKTFSTLKSLRRHVDAIHLKLRNFLCSYCDKGYPTNHALSVHLRRHTKETPYACEICGLAFRHNVSLKTHKKSKHGIVVGSTTSR